MLIIIANIKEFAIKNYVMLGVIVFALVYCRCLIHSSQIYKECNKLDKELKKIRTVIAVDKKKFVASKLE